MHFKTNSWFEKKNVLLCFFIDHFVFVFQALYDPLNPDKETLALQNISKKERQDNEFWLLEKFSHLLEQAHFYELPVVEVHESLKEHDAGDGVLVSVNPTSYDILRIWVVGKEFEPVNAGPLYSRIATRIIHYFKPSLPIERYKRVVIAIRAKKQSKLLLKAFKDIRCGNLEQLLPGGKIRMNQFDQRILAGMLTIGGASIVIKLVSFLADYKVSWTYIAISVAGFIALRAWNMYKNKRNAYLVRLGQTLYFNSIANNRALLTLLADRAEDEVFKVTLLAYTFLQASSKLHVLSGIIYFFTTLFLFLSALISISNLTNRRLVQPVWLTIAGACVYKCFIVKILEWKQIECN